MWILKSWSIWMNNLNGLVFCILARVFTKKSSTLCTRMQWSSSSMFVEEENGLFSIILRGSLLTKDLEKMKKNVCHFQFTLLHKIYLKVPFAVPLFQNQVRKICANKVTFTSGNAFCYKWELTFLNVLTEQRRKQQILI